MNPNPPDACLHRLLEAGTARFPETADGLTDHLPMALQALHELGASDERLTQFEAGAGQADWRPMQRAPAHAVTDWPALRGQADSYAALRAHFSAALLREGTAAVLQWALPDLLTGAAAAAFHGPIRTAHALQSGHLGELACALAYWAWRWQPLALPAPGMPERPFDEWAAQLETQALGWTPEAPMISLRIRLAQASAPYQALAGALRLAPDTLPQMTLWAAARYAATQNFTVLHMVTGLRAIGVLLPWAGPEAEPLHRQALVHALTAAYLAARVSASPLRPAAPQRAWEETVALAIASDDAHRIKLVHACVQLHRQTADPVFQAAALRAVA